MWKKDGETRSAYNGALYLDTNIKRWGFPPKNHGVSRNNHRSFSLYFVYSVITARILYVAKGESSRRTVKERRGIPPVPTLGSSFCGAWSPGVTEQVTSRMAAGTSRTAMPSAPYQSCNSYQFPMLVFLISWNVYKTPRSSNNYLLGPGDGWCPLHSLNTTSFNSGIHFWTILFSLW